MIFLFKFLCRKVKSYDLKLMTNQSWRRWMKNFHAILSSNDMTELLSILSLFFLHYLNYDAFVFILKKRYLSICIIWWLEIPNVAKVPLVRAMTRHVVRHIHIYIYIHTYIHVCIYHTCIRTCANIHRYIRACTYNTDKHKNAQV